MSDEFDSISKFKLYRLCPVFVLSVLSLRPTDGLTSSSSLPLAKVVVAIESPAPAHSTTATPARPHPGSGSLALSSLVFLSSISIFEQWLSR